jgi:four helix bundle protein
MHEKLHAYQAALQFGAWAFDVCRMRASIRKSLKDQLERATESIVLNIAEGNGKTTRADRNRFFGYARASAFECAAIIDLLSLQKVITPESAREQKSTLERIGSMLSGLMR